MTFDTAEAVTARRDLDARVERVATIIGRVARKYPVEHLPAGFVPLTGTHTVTNTVYLGAGTKVSRWFAVGSNLEFPGRLLRAGDRDIAKWARERIRVCQRNALSRARKPLLDQVKAEHARISEIIAELEQRHRKVEELQRQLANLAKVRPTSSASRRARA